MTSPSETLLGKAPGQFKELSHGKVHYTLTAPSSGEISSARALCVCVHGFSTECAIYEPMAAVLSEQGFAVLALDLYGRGFSDAAENDLPNSVSLLTSCVSELLLSLSATTKGLSTHDLHLIGYSMGGGVVLEFSRLYADLVASVVLLAPVGLPVPVPFTARLVKSSSLGQFLFHMAGRSSMLKHINNAFYDQDAPGIAEAKATIIARVNELFDDHPGYAASLFSTLRHFDFGGLGDAVEALGQSGKPVLLVWGENDITVPFANMALMQKTMGNNAVPFIVKQCAHDDLFRQTEIVPRVHERIIAFLNGE